MIITEYRVVSETDGYITQYDTRADAESRADQLNNENGVPDDHHVEKHVIGI